LSKSKATQQEIAEPSILATPDRPARPETKISPKIVPRKDPILAETVTAILRIICPLSTA